ncbi:MAG: iron-containing alcohol dehydrogenase [Planctomycetota bacterium]|jgi:alcohol dehydrogenase YqhD (iron-dependent ADH family)|nr:iron-containing alcohol dehydrogenase [Planctomycetota bacterium]
MLNFDYKNPTRIVFGKGQVTNLGSIIKENRGTRVLLHFGGGSIKKNGVYDAVKKSLVKAKLEVFELGGVQPNPRLSLVRQGIKLVRDKKIDFILAVGGGSVIDSAKGIGVGVPYSGDVWDFYIDKAKPSVSLPVGTVLTLPAAGSESSFSSVLTNDDGHFKRFLDNDLIYPVFSILDPAYTFSLPPYQTACGASDMLVHVTERYFTRTQNVELIDRLSESVIKTIIHNAPIALADPKNYEARAQIMWSGAIAHNNLLSTGRVGDWSSHMIEHELSAINDVAHGAGLAVLVPNWMKYVYKQDVKRFVQFAVRVFGVDNNFFNPEETALKGIAALRNFFTSIGMPSTLSAIGIKEAQFQGIAKKTKKFDPKKETVGNFQPLAPKDIVEILKLAK